MREGTCFDYPPYLTLVDLFYYEKKGRTNKKINWYLSFFQKTRKGSFCFEENTIVYFQDCAKPE